MKTDKNIVLITGGSAGIGLALAKKFMRENNTVIVTGRNAEKLAALKKEFPMLIVETADNKNDDDLIRISEKYKNINILINNAGVQYNYELAKHANAFGLIEDELDINLSAPIKLVKLFINSLSEKDNAAIINVSSGLGLVPKRSAPVYCASKAGMHIFTKALRYQLESTNIKVFEIIPPVVDTEMTRGRGKGKILPEQLVEEFWRDFKKDRYEMPIGKIKLLKTINRFFPGIAENIMKKA